MTAGARSTRDESAPECRSCDRDGQLAEMRRTEVGERLRCVLEAIRARNLQAELAAGDVLGQTFEHV